MIEIGNVYYSEANLWFFIVVGITSNQIYGRVLIAGTMEHCPWVYDRSFFEKRYKEIINVNKT